MICKGKGSIILVINNRLVENILFGFWFWGACVAERGSWRVSDEADKADGAVSLSENFCELLLNLVVLRVRAARTGKANIQKGVVPKSSICVSVCLHTQLLLVFLHKLLLQKLGLLRLMFYVCFC